MKLVSKNTLTEELHAQIARIRKNKAILEQCCVVFVYNSLKKCERQDLHISECVYDEEAELIKNALQFFGSIKLYAYDDETSFMSDGLKLKSKFQYVFVYSMAQNLNGVGRRCLIPLLCEYYGFYNLSSGSRASFLGGDKQLMHESMRNKILQPNRLFLSEPQLELIERFCLNFPKLFVKPVSESASIGIRLFDTAQTGFSEILSYVKKSLLQYGKIMLEEFLLGDEVECSVFPWGEQRYVAHPVKIIKNTEFLDYRTVQTDSYGFENYSAYGEILKQRTVAAYDRLQFDSVARFDFIVRGQEVYLFDITPNPTISECSSANFAARELYGSDERTPYLLLFINKLLLIPAFNQGE